MQVAKEDVAMWVKQEARRLVLWLIRPAVIVPAIVGLIAVPRLVGVMIGVEMVIAMVWTMNVGRRRRKAFDNKKFE